jgi:hypothetical protein
MALPVDSAELQEYIAGLIQAKLVSVTDAGPVHVEDVYVDGETDFLRLCQVERQYEGDRKENRVNYSIIRFKGFDESEAANDCTLLVLNYEVEFVYEFEMKRPDGTKSATGFNAKIMRTRQAFKVDRAFGHTSDELWHNFFTTAQPSELQIVDGVESHVIVLALGVQVQR